jgi:hypothetical protein
VEYLTLLQIRPGKKRCGCHIFAGWWNKPHISEAGTDGCRALVEWCLAGENRSIPGKPPLTLFFTTNSIWSSPKRKSGLCAVEAKQDYQKYIMCCYLEHLKIIQDENCVDQNFATSDFPVNALINVSVWYVVYTGKGLHYQQYIEHI